MSRMQPIDPSEREKIVQMLSEKGQQQKDQVDWMYSGSRIDRDAYLLGKPIDKLVLEAENEKSKETSFVVSTVDLANKIREDPLFEIKKREIEAKKRLLENPLKLRQLQQMAERREGHASTSRGMHKTRSRTPSTPPDRRKPRKNQKHKHKSKRSSDSETEYKKRRKSRSTSREKRRSRSKSRERHHRVPAGYGLNKKRSKSRSRSPRENPAKSKTRQEVEEYKRKIERLKELRAKSSATASSTTRPAPGPSNVTSKLSEEEKQRRLREMQDNAKWRDETRDKNIKKYRHEDRKEEHEVDYRKNATEATGLFNSMMRDAYVSAEDRIKRNMKNVQRNESAYDRNFARK